MVGGASDSEGRVEVYHNGEWGTVCDDGWDITDANVVCQQLNYSRATSAPGQAYFGAGSGPIHYDEVACTGTESRLSNCSHLGIGVHDCGHSEDAGVQCDIIQGQYSSEKGIEDLVQLARAFYLLCVSGSLGCIESSEALVLNVINRWTIRY